MSKKTFHIITYGCPMNQSDSERIAGILLKEDYLENRNPLEVDLVVINSCSIRQSAVDRIYGKIRSLKKTNKKVKIIVTGCLLETDKKKLAKKVDAVMSMADWSKEKSFFLNNPKHSEIFTAYLPISTGCNNYCSYCVVPYVRGPEKNRPMTEIVAEAKKLVENNYKEIILLGQNVNSYPNFPELLREINKIKGNFWLRFSSNHPKDLSDELIDAMVECEKITPYLNLPVQSGDNEIIKKMNRKYTAAQYKTLVEKIRSKIPNITLSTDIIVGFSGETKEQFNNTAKLMREVEFDMAYLAQFSPRAGTAAYLMKDDVPLIEKDRREKALNLILSKTALEKNKKFIGKTVDVLIHSFLRGFFHGRTREFKNIKIAIFKNIDPKTKIGHFVKAKVTDCTPWRLEGEINES